MNFEVSKKKAMQMQTLLVMLITEEVQLVIYLLLVLEQLVGCREYKRLSLYPLQRLSM
jgi:hypothetical protein